MADAMQKIIPIFVPHQGCPQRCVFCHQPHITGFSAHTAITPADIRATIDTALTEPKSRNKSAQFEVALYGGTFTGLEHAVQEQFLRTAQAYVDRGDLVGIRISTHPAMFDEAIFQLLSAYSVTTVELGVQSFDNDVLAQAGRGHTPEGAENTIRQLQRLGIAVGIHLMIGLPGDTHQISLRSAHRAIELRPATVRIHPTLVIRNTALESRYNQGAYHPLSIDEAVYTCKEMLKLFHTHDIPVIRIGLQPTDSMERNIVAGPYHPAFRQLVESALMYEKLEMLCQEHDLSGRQLTIYAAPQDISTVRGQKNANIGKLQQRFTLSKVCIIPDTELQRGELRVECH